MGHRANVVLLRRGGRREPAARRDRMLAPLELPPEEAAHPMAELYLETFKFAYYPPSFKDWLRSLGDKRPLQRLMDEQVYCASPTKIRRHRAK